MGYCILILIIIALVVCFVVNKKKNNASCNNPTTPPVPLNAEYEISAVSDSQSEELFLPYKRKNLMTKNEWFFYKQLKPVADKLGYSILCKVRVADLVDIDMGLDKSQWQTAFNKINKKHVDFILCKPENLYPELLIELDDSSHKSESVAKRDEFIEKLYEKIGYKLLRTQGGGNIEEKICTALELNKTEESV